MPDIRAISKCATTRSCEQVEWDKGWTKKHGVNCSHAQETATTCFAPVEAAYALS